MWYYRPHFFTQSSSGSQSLTAEQIASDLKDAPDDDVIFVSLPLGVEKGKGSVAVKLCVHVVRHGINHCD